MSGERNKCDSNCTSNGIVLTAKTEEKSRPFCYRVIGYKVCFSLFYRVFVYICHGVETFENAAETFEMLQTVSQGWQISIVVIYARVGRQFAAFSNAYSVKTV